MGTNIHLCVAGSIAMISCKPLLVNSIYILASTYTLVPGPVSAHKVLILSFLILKVAVWSIVDVGGKLRVCKDVVDDQPGVAIPYLVFGRHPPWDWTILRTDPLILSSVRFPWNLSQFDCVDLCMKVLMINDRGEIAVGDERSAPDFEKLIDNALR